MGFTKRFKRYGRRAITAPYYGARYALTGADKANKALAVATLAAKNYKYIRGLVNSEMLKFDQTGAVNPDNVGVILPFHNMPQGDGDNQRTGNSILAKSLYVKLAVNQSVLASNTLYKILILQDNQQVASTTPSVISILDTVSTLAPLNSNTVGRYKVLKSAFFHTSNARDTVKEMSWYIPMQHHIRYNGVNAADVQKGGLYIMFLSDQPIASVPTIFYNFRLSYHDN